MKLKIIFACLITFLFCSLSPLTAQTQKEIVPSSREPMIEAGIYALKPGKQLFQKWTEGSNYRNLDEIVYLKSDKDSNLIICDKRGNLVKFDNDNNITGYKYIPWTSMAASDQNNNTYVIRNDWYSTKIICYDQNIHRKNTSYPTKKIYTPDGSSLLVDRDKRFYLVINTNDSRATGGKGNIIEKYDSSYRLEKKWSVHGKINKKMGQLSNFLMSPQNTILAYDNLNCEMVETNLQGDLIRTFQLAGLNHHNDIDTISLDHLNRIVVLLKDSQQFEVFDNNGNFILLLTPAFPQNSTFEASKFVFTPSGIFFIYDENSGEVAKFNADGSYSSTVITRNSSFKYRDFPQNKREIYSSRMVAQDNENHLYVVVKPSQKIHKLSSNGQLIASFDYLRDKGECVNLELDSSNNLYFATNQNLYSYTPSGDLQGELTIRDQTSESIKDFVLDSKLNLFILTETFLFKASFGDLQISKIKQSSLEKARHLTIDKKDRLHIVDGRKVKVLSKKEGCSKPFLSALHQGILPLAKMGDISFWELSI